MKLRNQSLDLMVIVSKRQRSNELWNENWTVKNSVKGVKWLWKQLIENLEILGKKKSLYI